MITWQIGFVVSGLIGLVDARFAFVSMVIFGLLALLGV